MVDDPVVERDRGDICLKQMISNTWMRAKQTRFEAPYCFLSDGHEIQLYIGVLPECGYLKSG